ncbi:MAG: hypothetical protein KDA87_22695 [Planctomycetales bacterium]|nr:hypothetical protein [Planctomycetales bacterium]
MLTKMRYGAIGLDNGNTQEAHMVQHSMQYHGIFANGWRFVFTACGLAMYLGYPDLSRVPWGIAILWFTFLSAFWRVLDPKLWFASLIFALAIESVVVAGLLLSGDALQSEWLWLGLMNSELIVDTGQFICQQSQAEGQSCPLMVNAALGAVPAMGMMCWFWLTRRRTVSVILLIAMYWISYMTSR